MYPELNFNTITDIFLGKFLQFPKKFSNMIVVCRNFSINHFIKFKFLYLTELKFKLWIKIQNFNCVSMRVREEFSFVLIKFCLNRHYVYGLASVCVGGGGRKEVILHYWYVDIRIWIIMSSITNILWELSKNIQTLCI